MSPKLVHVSRGQLLTKKRAEVEAIRREAVEQAERKALVEARERMEQQRWERRMEEIKLQNENERAKAKAAAAELDAKLETTRKIAFQEAEERMREEFELRKMVSHSPLDLLSSILQLQAFFGAVLF
jgi:hypothetical protein